MFFSKSKRGGMRSTQMVFFIGAELLVGALLLLALTNFIFSAISDSEEESAAKDIGLSIMTVSSSPYDLNYFYSTGNERLYIDLTEEERAVRVSSPAGMGVYTFKQMHNVEIVRSDIGRVLSLPIFFEDNKVFFEPPEDTPAVFDCEEIRARFPDNPKVFFSAGSVESTEEAEKLEELIGVIEGILSARDNNDFTLTETRASADIIVALEFSSQNYFLESVYYQSPRNANYQKISCNIIDYFSGDEDLLFAEFEQRADRWNERLVLRLGSMEDIAEGTLARYADGIIKAINNSIS